MEIRTQILPLQSPHVLQKRWGLWRESSPPALLKRKGESQLRTPACLAYLPGCQEGEAPGSYQPPDQSQAVVGGRVWKEQLVWLAGAAPAGLLPISPCISQVWRWISQSSTEVWQGCGTEARPIGQRKGGRENFTHQPPPGKKERATALVQVWGPLISLKWEILDPWAAEEGNDVTRVSESSLLELKQSS